MSKMAGESESNLRKGEHWSHSHTTLCPGAMIIHCDVMSRLDCSQIIESELEIHTSEEVNVICHSLGNWITEF